MQLIVIEQCIQDTETDSCELIYFFHEQLIKACTLCHASNVPWPLLMICGAQDNYIYSSVCIHLTGY